MKEQEFEYGPIARGCYIALFPLSALVVTLAWEYLLYYVILLLFLGFGLRILLECSGLCRAWSAVEGKIQAKWGAKHLKKRRMEIDRKERDKKYRHSHRKDPRLPKNW